MARGVNKVILVGNLGQDPEVRYTTSGSAVANVSLATAESWKDKNTGERVDKTEWHRLVFFGRLAEIAGEYLRKGSQVYVEGKIQTRKWQDANNQDRYTTEIVVNDMQMLGGGQGGGQSNYGQAPAAPRANNPQQGQVSNNVTQGNFNQQAQQPTQNQQAPANNQPSFDDFDDDIPF